MSEVQPIKTRSLRPDHVRTGRGQAGGSLRVRAILAKQFPARTESCYQGIEKPRSGRPAAKETPMTETPDPSITARRVRALARHE